jgi:hypothetical protein
MTLLHEPDVQSIAAATRAASIDNHNQERNQTMKTKTVTRMLAVLFLSGGFAMAQNPSCPTGNGYAGPPRSEAERAARQQACLEANGGVCPNGGPRAACENRGQGRGQGMRAGACDGTGKGAGNGKGQRRGPRDGSGNQRRNGKGV